jgi:hypothetical protein
MTKIWLDDERPAPDGWEWCKNPHEALHALFKAPVGTIEAMSLDHDLGYYVNGEELTGYWFLCAMEKMIHNVPNWANRVPDDIEIHSGNPVGRSNMQRAIDAIQRKKDELR